MGKSRLRILENYEIRKTYSASLTVMATIRCTDVADSAQFLVELELHDRGGRSFVASLLELLRNSGRATLLLRFGKSSGEGALNSECSSYYKTINALLQLHPGVTRNFFLCRSKRSGLLRTKENGEGVAPLLTLVEGRSSTEVRELMLSFIAWIRGSLFQMQSACGRCQWRSSRRHCHD